VVHTGAVIQEGAQLGPRCIVGNGVAIGRRCRIGEGCVFHTGAAIANEAVIGNFVYIGPHAVLINTRRPNLRHRDGEAAIPPILEDDVVLGAHALIMPGVLVERGAFVAAGSVVYLRVLAGQTVCGNPAKPLRLAEVLAAGGADG
jgi:acetyltransferase-like isoleucine patch superfamily enzyme